MDMERLISASILVVAAAVAAGGCSGKSPSATPSPGSAQEAGSGAGSAAAATPEGGSAVTPAGGSAVPPADDEGGEAPLPKVQASCLAVDESYRYAFGRTGGKLVLCGTISHGARFGCWDVDAKGALSARALAPAPGASVAVGAGKQCHEGLCWKPPAEPMTLSGARVAMHPDGKRAAALVGQDVTIYDVASKKAVRTFPLNTDDERAREHEITNAPADLWFVGETVFILGLDAGPAGGLFSYSVGGKVIGPAYLGVYLGGVALDEDKLVLNEDALAKLTIFDGRSKGKTITRKLPRSPCKGDEIDPELASPEGDYRRGADKCVDYKVKHLIPYRGAQIVTDGAGYIGLSDQLELFTLDGKLVEKSRVKLARCAP